VTPEKPTTELLFSYGTLQLEAVQLSTFGRTLVGTPDELPGFAQSMMKIEDPQVVATSGKTHPPIVAFTGRESDAVSGTVFQITPQELQNADCYEVAAYKRRARGPRRAGYPMNLWTLARVAKVIHQQFGFRYHPAISGDC